LAQADTARPVDGIHAPADIGNRAWLAVEDQ